MPTDVARTLREAVSKLTAERQQIDKQIVALQSALRSVNGRPAKTATRASSGSKTERIARRGRMSAAARKAVSVRMKAYWAKRRGKTSKGKRKAA